MNANVYKCCSVPQCHNTTIKTPDKVFIFVSRNKTMRNKWLRLARRDPKEISPNSVRYFCEDHFDLPNDMENYIEYRVMGSVAQVRMKPGCIPTKFECQPDRSKRTSTTITRPYILKKQRRTVIEECEKDIEERNLVAKHLESGDIPSESSVPSSSMQTCFTNQIVPGLSEEPFIKEEAPEDLNNEVPKEKKRRKRRKCGSTRFTKIKGSRKVCKKDKIQDINVSNEGYTCCAVPFCDNTSNNTPSKIFFPLPQNKIERDRWFELACRYPDVLPTEKLHFCEDHFHMPEDNESYIHCQETGKVLQVRMKVGYIPTKFECQSEKRKCTFNAAENSIHVSRNEIIFECKEANTVTHNLNSREVHISGKINNTRRYKVGECINVENGAKENTVADNFEQFVNGYNVDINKYIGEYLNLENQAITKIEDVDVQDQIIDENGVHNREFLVKREYSDENEVSEFINLEIVKQEHEKIELVNQNENSLENRVSVKIEDVDLVEQFENEDHVSNIHKYKIGECDDQENETNIKIEDVDFQEQIID